MSRYTRGSEAPRAGINLLPAALSSVTLALAFHNLVAQDLYGSDGRGLRCTDEETCLLGAYSSLAWVLVTGAYTVGNEHKAIPTSCISASTLLVLLEEDLDALSVDQLITAVG